MNDKTETDTLIAAPPEGSLVGRLFYGARNPAQYPLPPADGFDCPTGTCDNTACSDIPRNQLRVIEPFSRPHVERNACNRCPVVNPFEVKIAPRKPRQGTITITTDSEGNLWDIDSAFTAPKFHGDPGLLRRDAATATFRVKKVAGNQPGGWQCRYYEGVLDDTSYDPGTYDYADAPGFLRAMGRAGAGTYVDNMHDDMDVAPHHANPYYAPGLTRTF